MAKSKKATDRSKTSLRNLAINASKSIRKDFGGKNQHSAIRAKFQDLRDDGHREDFAINALIDEQMNGSRTRTKPVLDEVKHRAESMRIALEDMGNALYDLGLRKLTKEGRGDLVRAADACRYMTELVNGADV